MTFQHPQIMTRMQWITDRTTSLVMSYEL